MKRMSIKPKNVISTLIILFLIILLMPLLTWLHKDTKSLNIWIIDKTVPNTDYREHGGLFWLFNFLKIKNPNLNSYNLEKDYFGFVPKKNSSSNYHTKDIDLKTLENQANPEIIYLTDAYGVYDNDLKKESKMDKRSALIYGGVSKDDILYIKSSLKNNVLIGEFNILQSPTPEDISVELQNLFGIEWTKWYGRYYASLQKDLEVPDFIVELYENMYKSKWSFKKAGFVILSESGQIVVLEKGKDFSSKALKLEFVNNYDAYFNAQNDVGFYYWFEIVKPKSAKVLANFKFNLTPTGKRKLESFNLPLVFPAILKHQTSQYTSYYFAGDFADLKPKRVPYQYSIADRLYKMFTFEKSGFQDAFYWKVYVPMMKRIISDIKPNGTKTIANFEPIKLENGISLKTRIQENKFLIFTQNGWREFFIKGVNMGLAQPGKYFTQMPDDPLTYLRWFEMISQMNANTVRLYTLAPPEFYKALKVFNLKNPDKKLYLIQEIWPDEDVPDQNYLNAEYDKAFKKEIENVIDAIHGKAQIPKRTGRAYGSYTADVSMYTIAILIGRELEPDEVISTNTKNKTETYDGEYIKVRGSPTEVWLASACDYALEYETRKYNMQHPVAIVSWPTLDPISHPSEFNEYGKKELEYNDKAEININHFDLGKNNLAGFFGAYHIYPNYPDFMNNEDKYKKYTDEEGRFMYGGYLRELMENHTKFPALVAEFGLATGMGIAHQNPDGYNHGGLDEESQGKGIVRMMKAIKREGYIGGLIFEWMDEWAKKTWITEPFMIPYERHVLWHNRLDPEQNYGILANEASLPKDRFVISEAGKIKSLEISSNAEYLYLKIELDKEFSKTDELLIGIDTYDRKRGEFKLSEKLNLLLPSGVEFLLKITLDESKILAIPSYNISKGRYSSEISFSAKFENIIMQINKERVTQDGRKIPAIYHKFSILPKGKFGDSKYAWYVEKNRIYIRIPWMLLNVSDPSSRTVLDDKRTFKQLSRDILRTTKTDGFVFYCALFEEGKLGDILPGNSNFEVKKYIWQTWENVEYVERLKESYKYIQEFFATIE